MSKLYIAIREEVSSNKAYKLIAKATTAAHYKFAANKHYKLWLETNPVKQVCSVTATEFAMLSQLPTVAITSDESVLDNQPSCIVLAPDPALPKILPIIKTLRVWKPNAE